MKTNGQFTHPRHNSVLNYLLTSDDEENIILALERESSSGGEWRLTRTLIDDACLLQSVADHPAIFLYENEKVRATTLGDGTLLRLEIDGELEVSRSVMFSRDWGVGGFALLVSDAFSNTHKGLILDAYNELSNRCGSGDGRIREIMQRAQSFTTRGPFPLPPGSTQPGPFAWSNIGSMLHYLTTHPGSSRYVASRSLVVDAFDEASAIYGTARIGVAGLYNAPPHPFGVRELVLNFNVHNLSRNQDRRTWAGIMAHEVTHHFHGDIFDGGHGPGDFIYAIGMAVDSSSNGSRPLYLA